MDIRKGEEALASNGGPASYFSVVMLRPGVRVLALGPHVADIEIACGGTLLRFKEELDAEVHTAIFSSHYRFPAHNDRVGEAELARKLFRYDEQVVFHHTDRMFPGDWVQIQEELRSLRENWNPDIVLAPTPTDTHQDHQILGDAATREFRYGEVVWHYEINRFGVSNRLRPNVFVDLAGAFPDEERVDDLELDESFPDHLRSARPISYAQAKVLFTYSSMRSQRRKPVLDPELMHAVMRVRAVHRDNRSGYCEAFEGRIHL